MINRYNTDAITAIKQDLNTSTERQRCNLRHTLFQKWTINFLKWTYGNWFYSSLSRRVLHITMNMVDSVKRLKKCFFSRKCGSEMAHAVSTVQYITGMIIFYLIFYSYNLKLLFCCSYHATLSSWCPLGKLNLWPLTIC